MAATIIGFTTLKSDKHNDTCDCCGRTELANAVIVRTDNGGSMNLGTGCAAVYIYGRKSSKTVSKVEAAAKAAQNGKESRNAYRTARAAFYTTIADEAESAGNGSEAWSKMVEAYTKGTGKIAGDDVLAATRNHAASFIAKVEA